jgi:hypothetical protein
VANQDFGAGIDRLYALVSDDLHALVDPKNTAAIVGWGTTFNALHLVRGIRALHTTGCCAAAPPLLRSLLEYTVGTIWLADAGDDAVEILNRGTLHTHRKLNRALTKIDDQKWRERLPAEAIRNFESVVATVLEAHPDEYLLNFTRLLEEYGFAEWVSVYNVLAAVSHLSNVGAQRFFTQTPEAFVVAQLPITNEVVPCEEFAFGLLVDTMAAYDKLLAGGPWTAGLAEIATEYDFKITHAKRATPRK